jgi:hypothetical protein
VAVALAVFVGRIHCHQSISVGEWKWSQRDPVHDTEDRRASPDAQCERGNGCEEKRRTLAKRADCVANVLDDGHHGRSPPLRSVMSAPDMDAVTPDPFYLTETAKGLLPRFCRRQTLVYQILCG